MRLAVCFCEQLSEFFREDRITIHDHGFDAQPFEKTNAIHGEISGTLQRDASIRIMCDIDDFDFSRAKMNGGGPGHGGAQGEAQRNHARSTGNTHHP